MKINEKNNKLDKTLLLLGAIVLIIVVVALSTGGWPQVFSGFKRAGQLINTVWLRLLLGFTLGGLVQVLIPRALIAKWMGHASGLKGILIGSYMGIIIPGSPYVAFPIIASIYRAGAGVGPVIAFLTGRGVLELQMLVVWEIPFLGFEIPLARYITCLLIPPLVGLMGAAVFRMIIGLSHTANINNAGIGATAQQNENGDTFKTLGEGQKTE